MESKKGPGPAQTAVLENILAVRVRKPACEHMLAERPLTLRVAPSLPPHPSLRLPQGGHKLRRSLTKEPALPTADEIQAEKCIIMTSGDAAGSGGGGGVSAGAATSAGTNAGEK